MSAILWSWAVSGIVLLLLAYWLGGKVVLKKPAGPPVTPGALGVLVDNRGRYSLNHLQLVVWSIVVVSLISGVFFGRLIDGVDEPLGFTIPDRVLGLIGISVGSAVTVGAVKATKATKSAAIAAGGQPAPLATLANTETPPFFSQVFMLEEGQLADEVIDVTKFQSFAFTIILVVAYVAMAVATISKAKSAAGVSALPDISGTFLVLLGISYAGYAGGKLPTQT
jgi:hypothetical protein